MASPIPTDKLISPDQIEFLKTVDSPTIANAIESFNVRDRTEGFIGGTVRSLFPDLGVMVGYALTVTMTNESGEVADRDGYWRLWETHAEMPKPSVLAIQDVSGNPTRCAYAGEVMATLAQRLGAVGMVTDGGFRDLNEVYLLGMHYFACHAVVSHGNFKIVDVGTAITLDGQRIETGDILHGDINGIVIVPPVVVPGLPEAVDAIRNRERRLIEFIKSDRFNLADAKASRGY
jgi:4-hydroxy-4-methyl-2-oxoglutarate aldolase